MGADSGITGCTGTGAGLGATATGSTGMGADSSSKEAVYPLESWELLNRLFATSSQLCICCSVTATMSDAPVVMEMDPGLDPGCTGSGWITSGFIGSGSAAGAESWDRMESMSSIGAALGASAAGSGSAAGAESWDRMESMSSIGAALGASAAGSGSAAGAESWDRMESMSSIGAALGASAVGSGLDAPAAAPGEGIANWDRKSS